MQCVACSDPDASDADVKETKVFILIETRINPNKSRLLQDNGFEPNQPIGSINHWVVISQTLIISV